MNVSHTMIRALFCAALVLPVAAIGAEPDGFANATFGMSPTQVTALHPKMQEVAMGAAAPASGATPPAFPMRQFLLQGQTVGELGPCNLYWSFFRDKLMKIDFYCPDKAKVEAQLTRQFGTPRQDGGPNRLWGVETLVLYSTSLGSFSYVHRGLNDAMQTEMIRLYSQPGAGAPTAPQ